MKNPFIYIILVDYNSSFLTKKAVLSLQKSKYQNFQIILSDNSDKECFAKEYLAENNILYLKNKENLGFGNACNKAINYIKRDFDYIYLFNNDAFCEENTLAELVKIAKEQNLDIVGSKIINPLNNEIQCLAGGFLNRFLGKSIHITKEKKLKKLAYVCGASMFISKKTLEKVGLFDQKLFLYWDDFDYCKRAIKKKMKIGYAEKSIVYHLESSTSAKIPTVKIYYNFLSFCYICKKYKFKYLIPISYILRVVLYLVKCQFSRIFVLSKALKKSFSL